jgi:hypothetical protein
VKVSEAAFLPELMFPLLIGRGSLFGIFGLIGVGMCYILAILSLSSIDYLHKRRRLEDKFGSTQSADHLKPQMEDYEYVFRRMQMQQYPNYYNQPENVQMYPYYNPHEEQSEPNPQTYFSNKFNKPQYVNGYNRVHDNRDHQNRDHHNRDHQNKDHGYYAGSLSLSFGRQTPPYPHLITRMRRSFKPTSIQQKQKILTFLLSLDKNSLLYKFLEEV